MTTEKNKEVTLPFTRRVLGKEATQELLDSKIRQTIRSRKGAAPFFMKRGFQVWATLDGERLYRVRITEVQPKHFRDLTVMDASLGGFGDRTFAMMELTCALRRAGYRFRNINSYSGYKIQFVPIE